MEVLAQPILRTEVPKESVKQQEFSPYVNNGGTTIAVAGKDFCVIAADTRLSNGFSISSRTVRKIIKLTDKCILATSGMQADMIALHKLLQARLTMYKHQNGKDMSTTAVAQLLGNTLYGRRFFPYYTFNVLGGVDDNGIGCAYSYDAVGSFERVRYSSSGSGQQLIQPFLDNQVGKKNQIVVEGGDETKEDVADFVKDAFNSAGERDIYTGDHVIMYTVTVQGAQEERFDLKYD